MSSKGYATPLRLEGVALPLLQRCYLLFCSLAGLALTGLPVWVVVVALPPFVFFARRTWQRRCELGGAPVNLVWGSAQRWWWSESGKEREVVLAGDSYISRYLCVLNFRVLDSGERRSVILLPSSIGAERYRRLLVRFRITADPIAGDTPTS